MNINAIILAAGRGSRLGYITDDHPKCLTQLGGKSLIQWQFDAIRGAGIQDIAIVRGYLSQSLSFPGLATFENARWSETNMVMSLVCAQTWLNTLPCVISYSDIVYPATTIRLLIESQEDIVITYDRKWLDLWKIRFEDPLIDAETFRVDSTGKVVEIGDKTQNLDDIQGQYMGLLKFTPKGWRQIESYLASLALKKCDQLDMTSLLSGLIKSGVDIHTVAVDGNWYEVDTENDLNTYQGIIDKFNGRLWQ
jgi:L-glutamine-phosphate cytidylyltransferase